MASDLWLRRIAERQHGLCAVEQALEHLAHLELRHLVDDARWSRLSQRVLRLVGSPATREQELMAAVLDVGIGGALSHSHALMHWHVQPHLPGRPHVTRTRDRSNRPGRVAIVHEPLLLPEHHVVRLDDIPVVLPARALVEVAGMQRRGAELEWWVQKMGRLVDTAWAMRLVSGGSLRAMVDELAERGRPGIATMRQVLAERPAGYVPAASNLERRFETILADAGEPPMRRQVNCGDDVRWLGRVDFADPYLPVLAEIQSERHHSSRTDQQLDAERIARLRAAGFFVASISELEVWHQAPVAVGKVRTARADARAALAS